MQLPEIIESLLFAGQGALTAEDLARAVREAARQRGEGDELGEALARTTAEDVDGAIESLIEHYGESGRAFTLVQRASGWRLATRPDYADWVRGLFPDRKPARLSPPALETLAIVAYRQPVTKASIEAVRGVAVDGVLQSLLDRHLVRIAGRADLPGRPLLYETSDLFLEHFGIRHVDELPNSEELRRVPLPEAREEAAQGTPAEGDAGGSEDAADGEPAEQPSLPLADADEQPDAIEGEGPEAADEAGDADDREPTAEALEAAASEVLEGHAEDEGPELEPEAVGGQPGANGGEAAAKS